MTIAIVQHDIAWAKPEETLRQLDLLLQRAPKADLFVLSETFATGFLADPAVLTDLPLQWLHRQARERQAAFAASIAMRDIEGLLRNRLCFVRPDGTCDYYDKHHLFAYAGETRSYAAGQRRVVVEWRGVRFLLQVCYDLRFPVWSRNRRDYDAAIYVANWPQSRIDVWHTLLKARALENQCFVVGVGRIGQDPECQYCGGSVVIDAYGHTLAACPDNEAAIAVASLDLERLQHFRQKFPVQEDADPFNLEPSTFNPQHSTI